ncbi:ubiquinol-cytochrome c reductase subunit 8 [Exidia glandulosa HHB12029]|uniref:Cytochrome b-c1 complex subunit 8 n=1 Tax=Exidia glandulosa HHB12029 TaxID=1314781 RepID=A0A166NCH3_EXIGL|nr:ubiquinol-cytochrome c reductase subunit 8 [Exidia glandulosa HHB12029]KZV84893.1 ubiquinol-cytochrome c reductase subunit 8 [Exidia glandulosa HHB12029]KZW00327.1 ubiquinol-cytochrome c reductase subunit 8 [Exidia glandulosa HHB12029]
MRPTRVVFSGPPEPKHYMGWWGHLGSQGQKGIVTYSISPFRQRPFAGALNGYIFNGYKRIMKHVPYWIVPVAIAYGVMEWGDAKYHYYQSKAGHAHAEE